MSMINNNPQKNDTGLDASRITGQTNISRHIVDLAKTSPYKKAVICLSGRDANGKMAYSHLTYRQFNQQSDDIARGLQRSGVVRGTKTALQMTPGVEWFTVAYALLKIGAVPVLIQPSLGFRHMAQCIKAVEPEALIISPKFQMLPLLYPGNYQSVHLQINTDRRWLKKGLSLVDLQQNEPGPFQVTESRDQDPGMIIFSTTNETETPKPILLTHKVLNAIADLLTSVMDSSSDSVFFTTFPLFMILAPSMGIRQIVPSSQSMKGLKINPRMIVESVWDHGITHLLMSPTHLMVLEDFLKDAGIFLPSIQRMLSWGEAFPAQELQKLHYFINDQTQVFPLYGMAEAPVVTTLGSHEIVSETQIKTERGFGICQGKVIENMQMRVIEVSDRPIDNWSDDLLIEEAIIGELVVKGEAVSKKYSNNVTADALTKIPDGKDMWHRTGDVGWLDAKGYFWFCGRKKDRIIVSEDETLYTIPCEAVFLRHQRVHRCIIVGVGPIPYQTPVLIIELARGDSGKYISTLTHELIDLAQAYPHTGNIKKILFRKSFPVHPLYHQKINRKQLTIWAAKKLGKSLPDEIPDRVIKEPAQTAVSSSALEKNDEILSNQTIPSNTSIYPEPPPLDQPPLPEAIPETVYETLSDVPPDESLVQTSQMEPDDDFPPHEPLAVRIKTAFRKLKEKATAAIKRPASEPKMTNIQDEIPNEEYITADHQVAMSGTKTSDNTQGDIQDPLNTLLTTDPNISYENIQVSESYLHQDVGVNKPKESGIA
ncbi:MAG: AMP-binding protein [Candidatus Magnetomorum sp.]|nr:AMP-binding protein [Candidatus Magnetomorum sp.]